MTKAIIYTTSTCVYCKPLKAYLTAKGIDYIEKNADDPEIRSEAMKISGGATTVPITVINDKVLVGYNLSKLADAIGQGV